MRWVLAVEGVNFFGDRADAGQEVVVGERAHETVRHPRAADPWVYASPAIF